MVWLVKKTSYKSISFSQSKVENSYLIFLFFSDETHFIETIQYQESLPLVDESAAPIASPDDCLEEIQTSSSTSAAILTEKTDLRAQSESKYPKKCNFGKHLF